MRELHQTDDQWGNHSGSGREEEMKEVRRDRRGEKREERHEVM